MRRLVLTIASGGFPTALLVLLHCLGDVPIRGRRRVVDRAEMRSTEIDDLDASYPELFRELRAVFRGRGLSIDESNDLAQETVLRTLVHIRRHGQTHQDLRPLSRTIAKNLLIGRVRLRRPELITLEATGDVMDDARQPLDEVLDRERSASVRTALASLTPRHRRILEMSMQGLTPSQIARELGVKRNAADALLHRAKRSLATKLGSNGVTLSVFGTVILRFRAAVRRGFATAAGIDPSGALGHATTGLAAIGLAAVLASGLGAPRSAGTVRHAPAASVQVAERQASSMRTRPASATADSPPATSTKARPRKIGVETHTGAGDSGGVSVGLIHRKDEEGRRGVVGPALDTAVETACSSAVAVCEDDQ